MIAIAFSPSFATINSPSIPYSSSASRTKMTSAGLSSTSRIETALCSEAGWLASSNWDRKEKRCTPPELRLHPNSPSRPLGESLANCQAHAGAWILGGAVKPLEDSKDLLLVLRIDPDTIVLYREQPFLSLPLG